MSVSPSTPSRAPVAAPFARSGGSVPAISFSARARSPGPARLQRAQPSRPAINSAERAAQRPCTIDRSVRGDSIQQQLHHRQQYPLAVRAFYAANAGQRSSRAAAAVGRHSSAVRAENRRHLSAVSRKSQPSFVGGVKYSHHRQPFYSGGVKYNG